MCRPAAARIPRAGHRHTLAHVAGSTRAPRLRASSAVPSRSRRRRPAPRWRSRAARAPRRVGKERGQVLALVQDRNDDREIQVEDVGMVASARKTTPNISPVQASASGQGPGPCPMHLCPHGRAFRLRGRRPVSRVLQDRELSGSRHACYVARIQVLALTYRPCVILASTRRGDCPPSGSRPRQVPGTHCSSSTTVDRRHALLLERICRAVPGKARLLVLDRNHGKAEAVRRGLLESLEAGSDFVPTSTRLATPGEEMVRVLRLLQGAPARCPGFAQFALLGAHIERRPRGIPGRCFATLASLILRLARLRHAVWRQGVPRCPALARRSGAVPTIAGRSTWS